jgi:uncharacterized damage-inducible protein DinB
MSDKPEAWLRGPLDDMPGLLQPVAHALLQAQEEVNKLMTGFPDDLLWEKPADLASPGFHLKHISGVVDRLFTYARRDQLNQQQLNYLANEDNPEGIAGTLLEIFNKQIDDALSQLRSIDESTLIDHREVGRNKLPSTVMGLYVHAAEHTMRHVGQLLVTVRVLQT